ncbi:MAG: Uncharacterised protein [Candidatus Poseidoniaceae archaeon]|nr:MAG: Uncharacterised protein [Candidatus Poseidoniaceae archaeon]
MRPGPGKSRRKEKGAKASAMNSSSKDGFIRPHAQASCMSETEGNHSLSGSGSSTAELGVSEASLELAERVALRLDIYDKPAIFNMLSSRAKLGAGIVTVSFLLWWLLINNTSSDDLAVGVSKFFALDYNEVALAVMALAFLHSAFGDFGREMGSLVPSLISGVMIIMVLLYVGEPVVTAFMSDSMEVNTGLWRSLRLALVGAGTVYGGHLIVDAYLLLWLRRFLEANEDIVLTPPGEESDAISGD